MKTSSEAVWIVCSNRWYSAVTAYAINTARALSAMGYECVFSPLRGSPGFHKAVEGKLKVEPIEGFSLRRFSLFSNTYQRIKPRIIFLFGGPETFLCYLLDPKGIVIRFRGQDRELLKVNPFSRFAHKRLDMILTPSQTYQRAFKTQYSLNVGYVAFGADEASFFFQDKRKKERPVLLLVGRMDPIKGHFYFLQLFKKLLDSFSWPEKKPLLKILGEEANLKKSDLVKFATGISLKLGCDYEISTTRVKNMREEMNQATVGLVSSLGSEIICRVGTEFLLCGTPIMVTTAGSLEELLFKGAGIVYEAKPLESLCSFILNSFEEPSSARIQRQNEARSRFSLETMGSNLKQHLKELERAKT